MALEEDINQYFNEKGQILEYKIKEVCKQDLTNLFTSIVQYYTPQKVSLLNLLRIKTRKVKKDNFEIIEDEGNKYLRAYTQISYLDELNPQVNFKEISLGEAKSRIKRIKNAYITKLSYYFESWLNSLQPSEVGNISIREHKKIGSDTELESTIQITNAERFLGFDDLKINDKYMQVVLTQRFDIDLNLLERFKEKLINYLKTI